MWVPAKNVGNSCFIHLTALKPRRTAVVLALSFSWHAQHIDPHQTEKKQVAIFTKPAPNKIYQHLATTQEWTHSSWTCWLCCFFLVRVQVCAFNGFACSIFCWCLRRFGDSDVTQNTARHQHKQARNTCQISPNLLLHFLHLLVVFLWGIAFATATGSCLQARSYWGWIPTSQNPWWSFINTHTMSWTALTSHKRLDLDSQPCSRCVSLSLSLTLSLLL